MTNPNVSVHFDPLTLTGRVYYDGKSFERKDPFDAVFTVLLLGDGRARVLAAHGKVDVRAYGAIARKLRDDYAINSVEMDRHGRAITVDTGRASNFGDL